MKPYFKVVGALAILIICGKLSFAQTDVVIAIDLSRTMEQNDRDRNRFLGADQFLTMFSLYGNNRGGVVAFGDATSDVFRMEYLSPDQIGKYKPVFDQLQSENWTELGKGLMRGKDMLTAAQRRPSIILISDGIVEGNPNTRGVSVAEARAQAEQELYKLILPALKAARIRVYTIGLLEETKRGEPTLQRIAQETGGFYTRVEKPQDFPQIYKRMLDDIDQPSGVAELTADRNTIMLTPFDEGVIIFGRTRFAVRSPNNLTYSTDKQTSDTPVKQRFFEYSNQTSILFLGRPDNIEQNGQFWTGKWTVEALNGKGEATFISNVRLVRDPNLPLRREYFLNEFYPVKYQFSLQPGVDSGSILSKCRAELILAPQGASKAKALSGAVSREGNIFKGESLLDAEGDYIFEIRIFYENLDVERWKQRDLFHVNKTPLVTISSPSGATDVGGSFRIETQETGVAQTSNSEVKGLVDSSMTYSLRYGSDEPITLPAALSQGGTYRSEELEFLESGDLELQGLLNGKLLMQIPGANGEPEFKRFDVKALARKNLKVRHTTWGMVLLVGYYVTGVVGFIASVMTILAWKYQRPRVNKLNEAALIGANNDTKTIGLAPEDLNAPGKFFRWFKPNSTVTVGGPQSSADIRDYGLANGGSDSVFEIGVNLKGDRYHITRKGNLDVKIDGRPLEPNQPEPLANNDIIYIEGVGSFKFQD